jgi:hypothetical protein
MRPDKKTQPQNSPKNKTDNNGKHYWGKVVIERVVGTVVAGVIVWYVTGFISSHYVTSKQDFAISQHIDKIINDPTPKHKSYSYLKQIKDKDIRIDKANDVINAVMDDMIIQQSYSGKKFIFHGYSKDTNELLNVFAYLYSIDNKSATDTFNYFITKGPDVYGKYTNKTEYNKLLSFIASNYNVKELTTGLPKESLQLLKIPRYKNSTTAVQRGEAIIRHVMPDNF